MPSRGTARILRAAVAAIRPRGHGFDQPIDADVLSEMQRFFVHLPTPMRLGFPVGLRLLEWGPPVFARPSLRQGGDEWGRASIRIDDRVFVGTFWSGTALAFQPGKLQAPRGGVDDTIF